MLHSRSCVGAAALALLAPNAYAADHGPVFGLATPTNPKGGWSFELGVNGRDGAAGITSALEAELTYGITENQKTIIQGSGSKAPRLAAFSFPDLSRKPETSRVSSAANSGHHYQHESQRKSL